MKIKSDVIITIGGVLLSLIVTEISKNRSQRIVIDGEAIKQAVRQRQNYLVSLQVDKKEES